MRDEFVLALAPTLVKRLAAESPQTRLNILPYEHHSLAEDLGRRTIDVAVAVDPPRSDELVTELLYREAFVCVTADRDPLTLERYLSAAHVTMRSRMAVARRSTRRSPTAATSGESLPRFLTWPRCCSAAESEGLCATLPVRVVLAMRPARFFVHTPPVAIPDRRVMLAWHRELRSGSGQPLAARRADVRVGAVVLRRRRLLRKQRALVA